ncbi:hypothetical protein BGX30_008578 [Mortierella sp. GBA39]|nr:hypothetical protein BGX30_008578 [Mortierella sp. GBA39]
MTKDGFHASPSKVLFMSEATDVIGTHLSSPDLLHCILVCREWNTLFIPHLYETFDDSTYSWPLVIGVPIWRNNRSDKKRDVDWILKMFTTYGHLIRRLCTKWTISLDTASAAGSCTRLRSLNMGDVGVGDDVEMTHIILSDPPALTTTPPFQRPQYEPHWIAIQWLWRLIQQNSDTLQNLEIVHFKHFSTQAPVIDLLVSCPRLSRLALSWHPGGRLQTLLDRLPQLQHYEFIYPMYAGPPGPIEDSLLLTSPVTSLVGLRITGSIGKQTYFTLLKYLPNLQRLWIEGRCTEYVARSTPDDFVRPTTRIQRFDFARQNAEPNDQLVLFDILSCSPELSDLSVPFLTIEVAMAIIAHCPHLQVFRESTLERTITRTIKRHGVVNATSMLLETCRHLTVLDAVHMEIAAEHLISHSWICQGLEVFRCQIIGVNRLSEEEEMDYRQGLLFQQIGRPLSENESAAIEKYHQTVQLQHRQIYDQLAKMTSLKVLDIGMEYRNLGFRPGRLTIRRGAQLYIEYDDLFPDTLELSLASGLDRLATLEKLEVFGFQSVDHRIDENELQWMAEKWPRLRVMRGLQEPSGVDVMHDGERWHRRVFMQRLRPFVKHEDHS